MAKRPTTEDQAIRLYAGGMSMEEISRELDVSQTSLYKWKAESKTPGEDADEWDNRRKMKFTIDRAAIETYERHQMWVNTLHPSEITPANADTLAKLLKAALTARQLAIIITDEKKRMKAEAMKAIEAVGDEPLNAARIMDLIEEAMGA